MIEAKDITAKAAQKIAENFLARLCRRIRALGSGVFAIDALPQIVRLRSYSPRVRVTLC